MEYRLRPHSRMPRIYLYRDPVDFRKSFRGLAAIVEQELGHNPFEGALYAFINIPAQARVIEYWQEKAVFDTEDGGQQVKTAVRPAHPLGKCQASVRLLAWVLVTKYADALALYRLEGILKRHGGRISRTVSLHAYRAIPVSP